jgi:hypothetical protein
MNYDVFNSAITIHSKQQTIAPNHILHSFYNRLLSNEVQYPEKTSIIIHGIRRFKMRKSILILVCLTLLPTAAFAESQDSNAEQIKERATQLCKLLKDPDRKVRGNAIHDLRMMARRTNRMGGKRIQRDQEFAPQVEGLVPYLVSAANDDVEVNRISALYALADTRDPLAVKELRNRLKDSSEKVRFFAACFLTEYQDASGLTEMRNALAHLRKNTYEDEFDYYSHAEILLASFERIIGKSFGEIPLNPTICSDTREISRIKERYSYLLEAWEQWWSWEPKVKEQ